MGRNIQRIENRNSKMYKRYKKLYEEERKRLDDTLSQIADEFYINEDTVKRIIAKASIKEANEK